MIDHTIVYTKKYYRFLINSCMRANEFIDERKRKKSKKSKRYGGYFFPGYAYFGGSGEGDAGAGDSGGGECVYEKDKKSEKDSDK